ncbi:MAG: thioredoxin [Ignavibacteria bacterium]
MKHIIFLKSVLWLVILGLGLVINSNGCSKKDEVTTQKPDFSNKQEIKQQTNQHNTKGKMEHLTVETFKQKVFNYDVNHEWKFEGDKPCIIDFYADWCGPCKMVAPILEELAQEYEGQINIYKVDTETEQELAAAFGIRSIPSILFCPMNGQPQMAVGALPKESFKQAIEEILLNSKN